jgi:hypothetical protein
MANRIEKDKLHFFEEKNVVFLRKLPQFIWGINDQSLQLNNEHS